MSTATARKLKFATFAEVQDRLGDVPPSRIRIYPYPGTATARDLLDPSIANGHPCELVDGILVEKTMGWREGSLGLWIGTLLNLYLMEHNIGLTAGADGMVRFNINLVRMPDVSFIRWDSVEDPDELEKPTGAFLETPPDLIVEVLSPGNTRREMEIKLAEYARAGVKLAWYVDPDRRVVEVYPKCSASARRHSPSQTRSTVAMCCPTSHSPSLGFSPNGRLARRVGRKGKSKHSVCRLSAAS